MSGGGGSGGSASSSTLTKKHLDELNRTHAYNQGSMMSLQMNKNIELLSEDGKQATLCLMNLVTKANGAMLSGGMPSKPMDGCSSSKNQS